MAAALDEGAAMEMEYRRQWKPRAHLRRNEMKRSTCLRGGTVVNHSGEGKADIGVIGGRIVAIGDLATASAGQSFDAVGLHILPGVIDTQVHFREPGNEHKEDLETGTRAAALGGVTAIFEMPNTAPPTTSVQALRDKVARQRPRASITPSAPAPRTNAEQPARSGTPAAAA
jgi:dihydroorotase-like cyclic amidohydrolase